MGLIPTVILLLAGLAGLAFCAWYERRPRELGEVRYLPTTLILFVAVLMVILAIAHLVTLVTGEPFKGRRLF